MFPPEDDIIASSGDIALCNVSAQCQGDCRKRSRHTVHLIHWIHFCCVASQQGEESWRLDMVVRGRGGVECKCVVKEQGRVLGEGRMGFVLPPCPLQAAEDLI